MTTRLGLDYATDMAKRTLPEHVREALEWLQRERSKAGGKARWKGVSPAERTAHAKKAVAAREARKKLGPKKRPPKGR